MENPIKIGKLNIIDEEYQTGVCFLLKKEMKLDNKDKYSKIIDSWIIEIENNSSFRYYRLSKINEDCIESFRNQYFRKTYVSSA